jgi:hypothetical protein
MPVSLGVHAHALNIESCFCRRLDNAFLAHAWPPSALLSLQTCARVEVALLSHRQPGAAPTAGIAVTRAADHTLPVSYTCPRSLGKD